MVARGNNRPPGIAATIGLNIPLPWGREASEQQAATAQMGAAEQRYEAALLDIQSALGEALAVSHFCPGGAIITGDGLDMREQSIVLALIT